MNSRAHSDMWTHPSNALALSASDVHVWLADLDTSTPHIRELYESLSLDERARAERFYSVQHRLRFIAGRAILRAILSRYLGTAPGRLRFRYAPGGKPFLADGFGEKDLLFNLSHSDGVAVYALTQTQTSRNIGVDIERIKPEVVEERVAELFFSPNEVTALRALPPSAQPQGFFNCWTRKEAYIKAVGEGLALPLDRFEVSLVPGEPAALLAVAGNATDARQWSVWELSPREEFATALAVKANGCQVKCRRWG